MLRKFLATLAVSAVLVCTMGESRAELYKWVDENGKIHYSDKSPGDDTNPSVLPQGQPRTETEQPSASLKPVIRPYEKTARKLHLLDVRYLWKAESQVDISTKIGVYHSGKGCISRGAMKTPDVFIHHKSMLPAESKLTYRINKIINGLDYDAERTERYRLLGRLKKTGGLSLHAEIVDLDVKSCAPNIRKSERLNAIESISAHRFTKHRVRLQVKWQLKTNRDQDVIYEALTSGSYNGWNRRATSTDAIGNALESAVLQLFSKREFIGKILVEEDDGLLEALATSGLEPINTAAGIRTHKLFLLANGKDWIKQKNAESQIGHLLFGDKCAARRPLPLGVALTARKWLTADDRTATNAIVKATRPLGYAVTPASGDTLARLEDSGGFSLNARITNVVYDACAPSLSASAKYKPLEQKAFRRLSRNRVQVWVEWTLKGDRNRKLLYRSNTMGFAGSLIDDSSGQEAMNAAISMAAEQLFADRDFVQLITVKPTDPPSVLEFTAKDNSSVRGIVLPDGQQVTNLLLVNEDNPWTRITPQEIIGLYAYGSKCLPYRERRWPDAINDHPRTFPNNDDIVSAASRVVKGLGYAYRIASPHSVVSMKRKLGGYSLHAEIVGLRFDSCAPDLDEKIVLAKRKISSGQFKRHRVVVRVNWKLIGAGDKDLLFDQVTEGVVDSWLLNSSGKKVMALAIANATRELFAQAEFVARLGLEQPAAPGILNNLFSFFGADENDETEPGLGNRFLLQAHAAQAFSELNELKIGALQYYAMEGDWPDNLAQIGYSESMFNHSETIDYVNFQPDGSIVAELKELFGRGKIITLSPLVDGGSIGMNRWNCSSNLSDAYLPQSCEGL